MKKLASLLMAVAIVASMSVTAVFAEDIAPAPAADQPKTTDTTAPATDTTTVPAVKVTVNGTAVVYPTDEPQPMNDNGTVYVPLRATLNAFGFENDNITWDQDTKTVTTVDATTGMTTKINLETSAVQMTQGTAVYTSELTKTAILTDGRTLVPIRTFSNTYFKAVDWVQDTQTVVINNPYGEAVLALKADETNNVAVNGIFKAAVSTDGNYNWAMKDNSSIAYIGIDAEGAGGYSMYFAALKEGKDIALEVEAVKAENAEGTVTLPEAKKFTVTVTAEATVGIPNPMTEFATQAELEKSLGFTVKTLGDTKMEGFDTVKYFSIVSENLKIGQVVYSNANGAEITIRTAPKTEENITGINGATFAASEVSGVAVNIVTQFEDTTSAAYWTKGNYTYSVDCTDKCTTEEFTKLVEALVA